MPKQDKHKTYFIAEWLHGRKKKIIPLYILAYLGLSPPFGRKT